MELTRRRDRGADGRMRVPVCGSPWELRVQDSWVLPFMVTPARGRRIVRTDHDKKDVHDWGLGIVMMVRYSNSPVGPYDELLYSLPFKRPSLGLQLLAPRRLPVIYVSSEASLRNGRVNWGIRKELAEFSFSEAKGLLLSRTDVLVKEKKSGETIVSTTIYVVNIPFPVHLALLGIFNPAIVETKISEDGDADAGPVWLLIKALGFGWARVAITVPGTSGSSTPRLSPSWFGACFGLSLQGTLIFPKPKIVCCP